MFICDYIYTYIYESLSRNVCTENIVYECVTFHSNKVYINVISAFLAPCFNTYSTVEMF